MTSKQDLRYDGEQWRASSRGPSADSCRRWETGLVMFILGWTLGWLAAFVMWVPW